MKKKFKKFKKYFRTHQRKCLYALGCLFGLLLVSLVTYVHHNKYERLRDYVSNKVVVISNYDGTTGGTGFFINLPSGKVGILTNAHVCRIAEEIPLFTQLDQSTKVPVHIIEISKETDLCLIESYGTTQGLELGDLPKKGDKLYSVGHPALLPTSMTSGEFTGFGQIEMLSHLIDEKNPTCDGKNKEKKMVQFLFFEVEACLEKFDVLFSTIPSFPGNSGSPIVDSSGRVRGIAFAGDSRINWSIMLDTNQIKKFIGPY